MNLSPPPTNEKDHNSFPWTKWYSLVYSSLDTLVKDSSSTVQTAWAKISKAGSKLSDLETRNHSELQNIDSGDARHLTKSQYFNLTDTGQTSLHKHDHALQDNLDSADYSHLSAVQKTDLTDGGETILHKHDFDHVVFPAANYIGGAPTHVYTLQEYMDHQWSAGIVDGAVLTNNGDGTIAISAAVSTTRADTSSHSTILGNGQVAVTSLALTNGVTNYIYLDYNAGVPIWAATTAETIPNGLNKILAWEVHRQGTVLHYLDQRFQTVDAIRKTNDKFAGDSRFSHTAGGSVLGGIGLALTVTAGNFRRRVEAIPHVAFDTSVAGTANANKFVQWYHVAGVYTSFENTKLITTTQYDNGTNLVNLVGNHYGVDWVYILNDSPSELHVVKGQADYVKLSDAAVASPPAVLPSLLQDMGVLIGYVAYVNGGTVFDGIYSSFSASFVPSLATVHNGLSGLQGGTLNEYYHLTAAEYAALGATAITLATARQIVTLRV